MRNRLAWVVLGSAVLLLTAACQRSESRVSPRASVADELAAIVSSQKVPANLLITYDDMHGLWGGTTILLRGDGRAERRERSQGEAAARITERAVAPAQLLDLIGLLVELRGWEQRTPDRQPVPDESRATLSIRVGDHTSNIWEWVNEMPANARLSRIKDKMIAITERATP